MSEPINPSLVRPKFTHLPGPVLRLPSVFPILLALAFIVAPIAYWTGTYLPSYMQRFELDWPDPQIVVLVTALVVALIAIPAIWVWRFRVIDILALTLAQNALIFCGYFYFDVTAVHIKQATTGILRLAGLAVVINAVGFAVLFCAMLLSYQLAVRFRGRLLPLRHPAEVLDRRLATLLRWMGFLCIGLLASPMILTHSIPLLQGPEARIQMDTSPTGRALYNLATTFLPFVIGGLVIVILRGSRRLPRWEIGLIVVLSGLQILTTSRYPLSLALLISFSLISMERRWPRWLLVGLLLGYLVAFTGLSGFTEIMRIHPEAMTSATVIPASFRQAFLGDNLIDLRDVSWVLSRWNFEPFLGKTYLGGLLSMVPTGIFPERKEWHLGLNAIRVVGWPEDSHFGLRITFFGESFMNFGMAGVVGLGLILGTLFGLALRRIHLAILNPVPCLYRNLTLLMSLQLLMPVANTSDAFYFWGLLSFYFVIWLTVVVPIFRVHHNNWARR